MGKKKQGMTQSRYRDDPNNYAVMSAPHASFRHATEALSAFLDDVREARQKHRIPEVLVAAMVNFYDPMGAKAHAGGTAHHGNSALRLPFMAKLYGEALREEEEKLNSIAGFESKKEEA